MEDLKVYYITGKAEGTIDCAMDNEIEKIAEKFGLKFCGSGVEFGTKIRDLHYSKNKKEGRGRRDA